MKKIAHTQFCKDSLCRNAPRNIVVSMLMLTACVSLNAQVSFAGNRQFVNNYLPQKKEQRISLKVKNEKLSSVLSMIEKQTDYVFIYSDDDVNPHQRITLDAKGETLASIVESISKLANINAEFINDKIILRGKNTSKDKKDGVITFSMTGELNGQTTERNTGTELSITGKVTDETGEGISNVSLTVKGTTIGTATNANGNYSISIPDNLSNPVLVFSIIGYETQESPVSGRQSVNIVLRKTEKLLEDVVVVGYGTQRRSSVTGSVDAISKKAIEGKPVANLSQALQGTSPNLIIQQRNFEPGQGVNINIRGLGTLGDNTPLVVIDGIPGGDINLLNPNDIESVSILKDAGSAAIYGSRSANGVLLITTKKGKKNEKATVNYNGIYGIQSPRITYEPVHAWENAYYKNESLANSGLQPGFTPAQIQEFADRGDGDWRLDNILRTAPQQTHNVSISGGSDHSTYLLSLGYLNQENSFIGDGLGYKRYNIRLNQTTEIGKFKLNAILSYAKVQGKDHSSNAGTLIVDAGRVPLYYSFTDSAGNYLTNPVSSEFNPKGVLEKGGYRRSDNDEVFGNLNGEYAFSRSFKVRGVFGGTLRANHGFGRRLQVNFLPGGVYGNDREVYDENYKSLFTNLQLLAEYTRSFKEHSINVLVGGANESFKSEQNRLVKTLTDPNLGTPTTGTIINEGSSINSNQGTNETSINSLFGRAGYSFNSKYFAEFNFRYDGSSKFAKDNRWGFFPSVAVAWRVTEERFMDGLKTWVNDLKIRSSYGVLGNQNVNAYQYQTTFFNFSNAYGFNGSPVGGAGFLLGNPDLTWEKAHTLNIGADGSFFNRKLDISFDYFDKTTKDILYTRKDVPAIFGSGFPDYNVAEVKNRGWEVKATYNIRGKHLTQSISINVADNLNELLSLTSGANEQVERREEFELVRRVGRPITVYQGYRRDGYFQTLDDINNGPKFAGSTITAGDIRFVDRNKDGIIDDSDKFILGNPFPRYTFGFTYTASIKGFDLMLFIQGVGKRDAMLRGELVEPFHFGYGGTMYKHQTDFWTPTNPDAKYPRLAEAGSPSNTNNYRTGSDLYLFNAAYARLKNVQIGYTIPAAITRKAHIQRARFYLTGQNLLTLTKLSFFDPEITEFDNNTGFNTGANSARAYPLPVFYGFGLDITF
ncbi:TonB-dependent receptor [Terrimonas sp. NA20]|uniref:TonB-dependent receptor n=1 Tax=Terrimonas ginsenosidimutans TaxID=2908004 RepID=A0ABS9KM72_9BACT|nr:TonB-dependent receptor [Terrimonas ginsenosidimutans]MCG2613420.1 TonB-dependent receptor [Terrimonas ginsenosidimutans]